MRSTYDRSLRLCQAHDGHMMAAAIKPCTLDEVAKFGDDMWTVEVGYTKQEFNFL
jgi:hypothetical protein